jgi:methyl-accepting chemotaxis protein
MFNKWTFGKRLAAAFGLAGLTLVVIAIVAYQSTQTLIDNADWRSHTHQVRTDIASLLSGLTDAETGQRGYVITGDANYLAPYTSALTAIPRTFSDVQKLTLDNPEQQRRLATLQPLIDAKLAELKQTIDLRKTQSFEAALQVIAKNEGKTIMDQIRAILEEADKAESSLLEVRNASTQASANLAMNVILWGGLAGAILIGAIGWFITVSLGRQISTAVSQVQSSSAELQAAANQQAAGIREQSTSMAEITTTITELLASARQIAESAQRVSAIADQTANSAQSGDGTVTIAHDSIGAIRRQVDMIVNHMLALGKKSQEIGSVLDIVSELAEQTNILSINATIEAAGAGEAGKRFAVVADEIRKLADRVADSAKEIRSLIDDVRSSVNTTVMATETGSKAVDAGSQQFSDVAASFKAIARLVATTTEAAREIELSTKQQSTAVEQVNVAISNVAQAAKESEASTGQTLQTASQLASLSKDLLRLVQARAVAA